MFDFDGVLVESVDVKTRAFATLFEPYGYEVVRKVVDYHGKHGGVSRYEKFKYYYKELLNKPLTENALNDLGKRFSDLVFKGVISAPYVNGAYELLEKFHQNISMFVVSGTPQEELIQIIESRNLQNFFVEVLGAPIKKGVHIKRIMDSYGYDKESILFIGDSITDYNGALEAGVAFLGRVPGGHENPFPVHVPVIKDLADCLHRIDRIKSWSCQSCQEENILTVSGELHE